jgi:organic hydroperoxide reductase OsmC/OhrA
MADEAFTVKLDRVGGYQFQLDLGQPGVVPLVVDEPPPLGEGAGPSASRLLAAAVGNCLSASALYCLQRAHIDVQAMHTEIDVTLTRNEKGRLRIGGIAVRMEPEVAEADISRMNRCLEIFEDFCVVTQSVREGIAVDVSVRTRPASAVAAQ